MNRKYLALILLVTLSSSLQLGMARRGQYDEEAREQERQEKEQQKADKSAQKHNPIKNFAQGIKETTVDSTAGLISQTAESTTEEPPVIGTIEGARKGSGKVLDSTVKGAYKVATLGYGGTPTYEVKEPESESGEPTKVRIKIPGT